MAKTNFVLVCDNVNIIKSAGGQKLNIEGLFDSIFSRGFPAKHDSLVIVVNIELEDLKGKYRESFRIVYEGKTILEDGKEFEVDRPRRQIIHRIEGLILPSAGRYVIEVYLNEQKIGETYFMAKLI